MARKLTALAVENAKPRRRDGRLFRNEIADAGSNLYLIVQPSGARSWAVRFRFDGKPAKLTLGEPPAMTLVAARVAAAAALEDVAKGIDPRIAKQQAKAVKRQQQQTEREQKAAEAGETFAWAVSEFVEKHARRKTREITWKAYESILRRLAIPAWGGKPVIAIKKRDVVDLLDAVAENNGPYMSNRLRATLSKLFSWLLVRDVISVSPVAGTEQPHPETRRERTLDDAEIAKLWAACEGLNQTGAYIRLLLLTGARRAEPAGSSWEDYDPVARTLTISANRSKSKKQHVIPLSDAAVAIIEQQPHISHFIFPARVGNGPTTGLSHYKRRVDAAVQLKAPWRLHDTRRSVAAGLQRLKVRIEVIERALGHSSGVYKGIVGTYQTDELAAERRAALQSGPTTLHD